MFDAKEAQGLNKRPEDLDDGENVEIEGLDEDEIAQLQKMRNVHPLQKLGLGISVWLDMLSSLCRFFFLFSIVAFFLCRMLGSASKHGIADDPKASKM